MMCEWNKSDTMIEEKYMELSGRGERDREGEKRKRKGGRRRAYLHHQRRPSP